MTIWIEKIGNEISEDYVYAAYIGFKQSGYIIQFYNKVEKIHYKKGDVVIGCIQNIKWIMKKLGIELPNLYIPKGLERYSGRRIWKGTIGEALKRYYNKEKIFIKPIVAKEFPAQVIESMPLVTHIGQTFSDGMECWISDVENFISEYRIFLHKGEIIGCKHYWGDFKVSLDWSYVKEALSCLNEQPIGWCIDFGVTENYETLIIESNDGYSIGNYGLDGLDYSKLLKDRFLELTENRKLIAYS